MKAVVGAFNQEKALVGAFSVIVQLRRLIVNSDYCLPLHTAGGPGDGAGGAAEPPALGRRREEAHQGRGPAALQGRDRGHSVDIDWIV